MTAPLDTRAAEKLSRVCGMLGSDHPGERAAAALKAHKIIRDQSLTWHEVIALPKRTTSPETLSELQSLTWHEVIALPKRTTSPETLSELCGWLLGHSEILSPWEVNFLREISGLKSISPKQRNCLDTITAKVRSYREGAS